MGLVDVGKALYNNTAVQHDLFKATVSPQPLLPQAHGSAHTHLIGQSSAGSNVTVRALRDVTL